MLVTIREKCNTLQMSESKNITLSNGGNRDKGWLSQKIEGFKANLANKKETKKILTENELALNRMSKIAHKIEDLIDSPEFKDKEQPAEDYLHLNDRKESHVFIPAAPDGLQYGITIAKDLKGEPFMIEVYVSPGDRENYSSGKNDGYYRIYFNKAYPDQKHKGERQLLEWGNTSIHGDTYLGKDTGEVIEDISVDHLATRVELKGVDFGGHPSIHVTLNASARTEDGRYLGPIGAVDSLWVQGVARAKKPTEGNIMDSDWNEIKIEDGFGHYNKTFVFDLGEAKFQVAKTKDANNGDLLAFRFSGIRKRLGTTRDNPVVVGPENKDILIPMAMVNGFKVIDIFEKAVDATILACKEKPELQPVNR